MVTVKKTKKNAILKECPFAKIKCGDWCQLFLGEECVFQSMEYQLNEISNNLSDSKNNSD